MKASDRALTANDAQEALKRIGDPQKAKDLARFFKAGPGGYGEGDRFRGVRVPEQRRLARTFWKLPLDELRLLLTSAWHEDRLLSLFCMIRRYRRYGNEREHIHSMYLSHTDCVNNWDLVDSSAPELVGRHLKDRDRGLLDELAASDSLWERRIAMLATFYYIRQDDFNDALRIAESLLADEHDLIHKAVGWMLREIGKRDLPTEEAFLGARYREMPRTMLRYAIEKFPEERRKAYLKGEIQTAS